MRAHRALMVGLAMALPASVTAVAVTAAQANGKRSPPALEVREPLPDLVRIAQRITVTGRVRTVKRAARVALESERLMASSWRVVASTGVRGSGAFTVRWLVGRRTAIGPVKLRLVLMRAGRRLASTAPVQSAVGSAAVYCRPPAPPATNIPVGYGWIAGGVYSQGGPFPGIYACSSTSYTVTATNAAGQVAASETVPALRSYTLVVPAGSYTLASGVCRGMATVTAGRGTEADTDCDFP